MRKFKVGDRVILTKLSADKSDYEYDVNEGFKVGMVGTVTGTSGPYYHVEFDKLEIPSHLVSSEQLAILEIDIVSVFRNRFLELE